MHHSMPWKWRWTHLGKGPQVCDFKMAVTCVAGKRKRVWVCLGGWWVWGKRTCHFNQPFCLLLFSHSVMSNSLWFHGLQPASLLCLWDFPERIPECVAISNSRASSWSGDQTCVSCVSPANLLLCRQILYCWAPEEAPVIPCSSLKNFPQALLHDFSLYLIGHP